MKAVIDLYMGRSIELIAHSKPKHPRTLNLLLSSFQCYVDNCEVREVAHMGALMLNTAMDDTPSDEDVGEMKAELLLKGNVNKKFVILIDMTRVPLLG